MNVVIETERLLPRTFTEHDATLVYELNTEPDVTRYTHDPVKDIAHAKEILEKTILPQYALYNHARWAVHLKPNHEFPGWSGLKYRSEVNGIDLGYRFKTKAWERELPWKQLMPQSGMALINWICRELSAGQRSIISLHGKCLKNAE